MAQFSIVVFFPLFVNMADEKEQWWTDNHSEDKLSDAFEEAATAKLEREAELEQAKHALELAKLEAEKAKVEGTSQTPSSSTQETPKSNAGDSSNAAPSKLGVRDLGFWWLSKGEAVAVIIITSFVLVSTLWIGVTAMGEEDWPTTIGLSLIHI